MERRGSSGSIELICGSMFSGKTEELLRRVRRAEIARQRVQLFKPSTDDRYGMMGVASHDGTKQEATTIQEAAQVFDHLDGETQVVAIDEVQFFDESLSDVCQVLAERGLRVILAGLDLDFRGEPFGPLPRLMAQAEEVDKLHAICVVCGREASRTQRLINGKPAHYGDPVILVGAQEVYEARCRPCHRVPGKPIARLQDRP